MNNFDSENSTFGPIIKKVTDAGKTPTRFEYKGILHTVKDDIPVTKLLTVDIMRNYANNAGDAGAVQFVLPLGVYLRRLYPYRNNLEFTIKRTEMHEQGGGRQENVKSLVTRYKAIFLVDLNPNPASMGMENYSEEKLNNIDIVTVTLQITDRSLEPLRVVTVSGSYRIKTVEQVIRGLLFNDSNRVTIDGKPSIDGIDIVTPDNKAVSKHILIPSGTKLISVPKFIQNKSHGVYSAGMGAYLQKYKQKKYWFIFPLYNYRRFKENIPKAIFYALPQNRYDGLDRTFIADGNLLQVLITGDRDYSDQADIDNMNEGNGVRVADAEPIMFEPVEITANGPIAHRTRLNREVTTNARDDGLNYSPVSPSRLTANPYVEYTQILSRNAGTATVTWNNADPELLYPGMPCKYIAMVDKKPSELNGVIIGVQCFTSAEQHGVNVNVFRTSAQITISVEASSVKPKALTTAPKGNL